MTKIFNSFLFFCLAILCFACSSYSYRGNYPVDPPLAKRTAPTVSPPLALLPSPEPQDVPKDLYIKRNEIIMIDAGHGGKDCGAVSHRLDYEEKHLTLSTAHMIRGYLNQMGYQTVLTRHDDTFVPLSKRAAMANNLQASVFVSIHYNSCPSEFAEGIEVFYYKEGSKQRIEQSKALGQEVLQRLVKHTGASSRGVKTANFAVIRETEMPAILIEAGFLTHPSERKKLQDPNYRRFIAWSVARGIDHYLEKRRG